jgi:hypothetical protein|tara:strand:+ start:6015 stop:6320 length:306 start_codon:yes stop_codon:yes gene_type:complete
MRFGSKISWDKAAILWNSNSYLWNDVREILEELGAKGFPDRLPEELEKLDDKKKKKLIRLIMYLNDVEVYDEKKEVSNIKAYVEDVKLIVEEVKKNVQIIH